MKELKWADQMDMAMKAFKWWEAEPIPHGAQWKYIEHCGVSFPPAYEPHGVKMKYDGEVPCQAR